MSRAMSVLPDPVRPVRPTVSPGSITRLTWSRALTPSKATETSRSSMRPRMEVSV